MKAGVIQFFQKLRFKIQQKLQPKKYKQPVIDYFKTRGQFTRHALLIYQTMPFYLDPSHPVLRFHQNIRQSKIIAETLHSLGFSVDVVDIEDQTFDSSIPYNLIISHRSNEVLFNKPSTNTKKVYLATGTEHRTHNSRQLQRLQAFEKRHGKHNVEIALNEEQMSWPEKADAIFCFGNDTIAQTWRSRFNCAVLPFQNTALPELKPLVRDWDAARKHFLFLGSRLQLSKGLDILLETFSRLPDLHLHVCGLFRRDKAFCEVYHKELFQTSNIYAYGWLDVAGEGFQSLARQCGFTVSATCAEGSPGSVTNVMMTGMIPILPPEAGIDFRQEIFPCPNVFSPGFSDLIVNYSNTPGETLSKLSDQVVIKAKSEFTEEIFRDRWQEMILSVTAHEKTTPK